MAQDKNDKQGRKAVSDEVRQLVREAVSASHRERPLDFGETFRHVGEISFDGDAVKCHVIPSVDAILTDGVSIALISRDADNPLQKARLPGGMVDADDESLVAAALRELREETTIDLSGEQYEARVGQALNVLGSGDVRRAFADLPDREIREGDLFLVAIQPVVITVSTELMQRLSPKGEDDAEWAGIEPLEDIKNGKIKLPASHLKMVEDTGLLDAKAPNARTPRRRARGAKPPGP